jgi:hypothetical protein
MGPLGSENKDDCAGEAQLQVTYKSLEGETHLFEMSELMVLLSKRYVH